MSDWDSNGKLRHKQRVNRYVINVGALELLAQPGDTAKSEPITAPHHCSHHCITVPSLLHIS